MHIIFPSFFLYFKKLMFNFTIFSDSSFESIMNSELQYLKELPLPQIHTIIKRQEQQLKVLQSKLFDYLKKMMHIEAECQQKREIIKQLSMKAEKLEEREEELERKQKRVELELLRWRAQVQQAERIKKRTHENMKIESNIFAFKINSSQNHWNKQNQTKHESLPQKNKEPNANQLFAHKIRRIRKFMITLISIVQELIASDTRRTNQLIQLITHLKNQLT